MKTIKNMTTDQLRKSILQLAIQGKLVKQDPKDEPASVLVEKIYEEKKKLITEGKIKKEKVESRIFKGDDNRYYEKIGKETKDITDELPFEIPENWEWIRLENIFDIQTGVSFKKEVAIQGNKTGYSRVLRGGNINPFKFELKPDDLYVPSELVNNNIFLQINDLITPAVTSLENIGKIAKINTELENTTIGGFVYLFRPYVYDSNISDYLLAIMSSHSFIQFMKNITKKSGQAFYNMNKERLKKLFLPLAPYNEQIRIINKISSFEQLLEQYNKLEKQLTKLENEITDKLKKSILQCAIEGKLVKQDPNDEPASVLLERIKAEKEKLIKDADNCSKVQSMEGY